MSGQALGWKISEPNWCSKVFSGELQVARSLGSTGAPKFSGELEVGRFLDGRGAPNLAGELSAERFLDLTGVFLRGSCRSQDF